MSKQINANNIRNNIRNIGNTGTTTNQNNYINNNNNNNENTNLYKSNNNMSNFSNNDLDLNRDSKITQKIDCIGKVPSARFGHTITMVSSNKIVMFGGAIGDTKNFSFSNETYTLNISNKFWTKIEFNNKTAPCPRAAHASCAFGDNQLLMYGGSTGYGSLAGDELYYFDLKNGEEEACWASLTTTGKSPGRRYGHTLCCIHPNIILFGGNTGSAPSNDVYIISLSSKNLNSFCWNKLQNNNDSSWPSPRVYHASNICTKGTAAGMMILFGGRDSQDHALNDTWGLRRHRNDTWDWTRAPVQSNSYYTPKERYNHSIVFVGTIMILTGGRDKNIQDNLVTDVYDTETSEWKKFPSIGLFRHSCFIRDCSLYIYGGFENKSPNYPILNLYKLDMLYFFSASNSLINKINTYLQHVTKQKETITTNNLHSNIVNNNLVNNNFNNIGTGSSGHTNNSNINNATKTNYNANNYSIPKETPYLNYLVLNTLLDFNANKKNTLIMDNYNKDKCFILTNHAIVVKATDDLDDSSSVLRKLDIEMLPEESKRIGKESLTTKILQKRIYSEDIIDKFIRVLLRPYDWINNNELELVHQSIHTIFSKDDILTLLKEVAKTVYKDSTLIKIKSPVKVFGNIFGQYYDLMRFFETYGNPSDNLPRGDINIINYLFLGDYCDRGNYSLEIIFLLFALKVKYPESVFLLRGHHEDENVNKKFGLFEDCEKRLGNNFLDDYYNNNSNSLFLKINAIFDILPLAAIIDNNVLCLHGGIGSNLKSIQDIEDIKRPISVSQELKSTNNQILLDILYSEFCKDVLCVSNNEERDLLKTGLIVKYGKERLNKFLSDNNLSFIITSHSWIPEGVKIYNNEKIINVYSCTNYMDKAGNIAGMLVLTKNCLNAKPKLIDAFKTDKKYYKRNVSILSPIKLSK